MPRYSDVPERVDFPDQETETLKYWAEHKTFEESVRRSEGKPIWSFYDGPPFATGLPHYGHLLAGTIKDIMCRYAHQTGHYVERRFGWDCHGLPVEFEIDKKLGISGREDVLKMGVAKYNAECRSIVMRYSKEWEITVKRIGRWISFENDYKTMHLSFMESVWWVFGQLHAKGLVYRGFKVMPYSCPCNTPLSNFEVQQNYKTVDDPAVVCAFPLVSDPNTKFIAWTTTPWTLPSNLALCVNPTMEYVKVEDESGVNYILMAARLVQLYPDLANPKKQKEAEKKFKEVERFPGKQLLGTEYSPPFEYFIERMKGSGAFKVITGDFVTDDAGTGIVHCAPAFGEEDYKVRLCAARPEASHRTRTRARTRATSVTFGASGNPWPLFVGRVDLPALNPAPTASFPDAESFWPMRAWHVAVAAWLLLRLSAHPAPICRRLVPPSPKRPAGTRVHARSSFLETHATQRTTSRCVRAISRGFSRDLSCELRCLSRSSDDL